MAHSGQTLADGLARGPLTILETASIVAQMADALKAAHIVHRNLKRVEPDIEADEQLKVLDFG